ncbi:MAG: DUF308 domain-containing protein [Christensenellaceae bacterium]|jgi:uncharacterized membrane protein HdeD (DUF308 family)|nr:DUF308 domain-containing protein [Christensenellaceae bacterium]
MKVANKFKLLPIGSALLLFVLGIIMSAIAGFANEITLLLVMGLGVLAIGVARLLYGWFARHEKDSIPNFVLGAMDAVWGIIALALITTTGLFPLIFGIWLLTAGVVELAMSIKYVIERSPFAGIMIDGGINLIFGVMLFVQNFNNQTELYLLTAAYLFVNTFTSLLVTVLASSDEQHQIVDAGKEKDAKSAEQVKAAEAGKGTTQVIIIKDDAKKRAAPKTKDAMDEVADIVKEKEKKEAAKKKTAAKKAKAKKATSKETKVTMAVGEFEVEVKKAPKKKTSSTTAKKPAAKKPAAKKVATPKTIFVVEPKDENKE